jgi:hypothetical protein
VPVADAPWLKGHFDGAGGSVMGSGAGWFSILVRSGLGMKRVGQAFGADEIRRCGGVIALRGQDAKFFP